MLNNIWRRADKIKTPLLAILVAFVFGAVLILLSQKNPIEAYSALFRGAFGSIQSIALVFTKATPLIMAGLAVTIAYKCKSINIGGEGQLFVGALGASLVGIHFADLPMIIHIPLTLLAGFIGGGLWAIIPAMLKIKRQVNTVISTIMMNYVGIALVRFLINNYFRADNSDLVATDWLSESARLPYIISSPTRLGCGIIIAIAFAIGLYYILNRTVLGYEIKAVGSNPDASRSTGIKANRAVLIALIISGGLAGLAGTLDIMGPMGKLYESYAPGYGFDGISIALLAAANPIGVIFTALIFSVLRVGAVTMQTSVGVPSTIVDAMQGVIILIIAAEYIFKIHKIKRTNKTNKLKECE